MNLGSLLSTNRLDEVQIASTNPNAKVLFISDPEGYQDLIRQYRMILASAWVPDYNIMEADLNGDINEFRFKYIDYLNRPEAQAMFATVLLALYQKKDLILFFPPEAWEFKYPMALLEYISNVYGIIAGSDRNQYAFNPAYNDKIYSILYSYSFIPVQDFILGTNTMDQNDLIKVCQDMNIQISDLSNPKPVLDLIEEYKQAMIKSNQIMFKPVIVGGLLC